MATKKPVSTQCCHSADKFSELCIQTLKERGLRVTQPRRAVITCLAKSKAPLSARKIFERISSSGKLASIDQVSVYRILETLLAHSLVHQIFPSGGYLACLHRECSATLHILTRCSSCESIEELDVPEKTIKPIISYLEQKQGFQPETHAFQMNGVCAQCAEQRGTNPR